MAEFICLTYGSVMTYGRLFRNVLDKAFLHFVPNFCHFSKWSALKTLRIMLNYEKSSKMPKNLTKNEEKPCPENYG